MSNLNEQLDSVDVDEGVQEVLLAASQHDIRRLTELIRSNQNPGNPVNVRDPETGCTPLHAAIAACEPDSSDRQGQSQDGIANGDELSNLASGREIVKFLLEEGAIWNDLDQNDETPGCLAKRLGFNELYGLMVDAGVRAEVLLNRLDQYEPLVDEDEQEEEDEEAGHEGTVDEKGGEETGQEKQVETQEQGQDQAILAEPDVSSSRYLQSDLTFQHDRLLDQDKNGVMMSWESDIMAKSAKGLLPSPGLRVLNIGHGMGIIDNMFQTLQPSSHHILEAHPAVITDMKNKGWPEKAGVVIHEGKWQDVLPRLIEQGETFDAIYYDTFAESYADFREFFTENVIGLLDPAGKWGFFNGMGADRQISYDVYQKVVEMDLLEAGFDVDWEEFKVPDLDDEWNGVRRKYWAVDSYRLPLCRYLD